IAGFQEAGKFFKTDVVLNGLRAAQEGQRTERTQVEGEKRKQGEDLARQAKVRKFLDAGKANLANRQYDAAILALGEALKTDPNNAEARAALQEAEKGRTAGTAQAAREKEEQDRLVKYRKFLETGRANLAAKQYD